MKINSLNENPLIALERHPCIIKESIRIDGLYIIFDCICDNWTERKLDKIPGKFVCVLETRGKKTIYRKKLPLDDYDQHLAKKKKSAVGGLHYN